MVRESGKFYINIRETISYDIKLHGGKFVMAEFSAATIITAGVSLLYALYPGLSISSRLYGLFWLGFLLNCLTLLVQSVSLTRQGTAREPEREWSKLETGKLRRYTVLIGVVIIVPFATLTLAVYQYFRGDVKY